MEDMNIGPTLVVLTLLPVLQDHPVRSGRTLHSSPSMHGCIWHHHFWATMEAEGNSTTETVIYARSLLSMHKIGLAALKTQARTRHFLQCKMAQALSVVLIAPPGLSKQSVQTSTISEQPCLFFSSVM